jgi:glycine oxidase
MSVKREPPPDQALPLLILGGGLIGLAIAHELARRGRAVTVLSRRRSEAAGFVAAGMLAPHAEGLSGPLLQLGQASLERIPAWVERIEADSGLSCGLVRSGIVVPFTDIAERDAYPTAAWGIPLDRGGLDREVAGLAPCWQAGLLFPQDGQIDNRRRLMRALERACVHRGVHFEEGCELLELVTGSAGAAHEPTGLGGAPADRWPEIGERTSVGARRQDGRLAAVRLRRADGEEVRLACDEAVLCCGAWSAALLPGLPLVPVKGQMLSLQGPIGALRRVLFGPGTYLVPREDGLVVIGATSEPEAAFAEGLTPAGQRQLQAGLRALLPEASGWPPMERWWGFRPCTPDQAPVLGPGPHPGLWLATGHHRNGVLLAAITAELLGELLAPSEAVGEAGQDGDRSAAWLQAFGWGRFSGARSTANCTQSSP